MAADATVAAAAAAALPPREEAKFETTQIPVVPLVPITLLHVAQRAIITRLRGLLVSVTAF